MRNVDFRMELKRAECPVKVAEIVEKTIRAVYPHYLKCYNRVVTGVANEV